MNARVGRLYDTRAVVDADGAVRIDVVTADAHATPTDTLWPWHNEPVTRCLQRHGYIDPLWGGTATAVRIRVEYAGTPGLVAVPQAA